MPTAPPSQISSSSTTCVYAGMTNSRPYHRHAPSEVMGATVPAMPVPKHGCPMSQCSLPSAPAAFDARMPTKGHVPALPRIHDDAQ